MKCVNCGKQIKLTDKINYDYLYEDEEVWCMPCAEVEGDTGFVY